MRNNFPHTVVTKFYEVLSAEDQGLITKSEASDILFTYAIENELEIQSDKTNVVDIYFRMVAQNIDTLQWNRLTKTQISEAIAIAVGKETIELQDIDEGGLSSDYAFICSIFENFGYIDIYYLIPPVDSEVLLITGTEVSDE
jgi:hypothetical protein